MSGLAVFVSPDIRRWSRTLCYTLPHFARCCVYLCNEAVTKRAEAAVPHHVRSRIQPSQALDDLSDEVLVALAVRDRAAFGALYDRYVDSIYRYCSGRLGDRDQAEDATSQIFTRALAALPTQRGPSVRSWLFTIAHNVVLNTRRDLPLDRPLESAWVVIDPSPPLDDLAAERERRHALRQALTHLPDEQRRIVELRLAGLTGPEIAITLGRSHDAVRTSQRRALAQLRVLLGLAPTTKEGRDDA
jgi:RNA polymerase sigma-70 factor, ECF subfamily